jgi:plasmid stabilization system protein ParE
MSLRGSISGRAEADLTHQYRWYLDNATVEVAERFLAAFDATMIKLARQPGFGRRLRFRSPELAGLRSFPVGGRFAFRRIALKQSRNPASLRAARRAWNSCNWKRATLFTVSAAASITSPPSEAWDSYQKYAIKPLRPLRLPVQVSFLRRLHQPCSHIP